MNFNQKHIIRKQVIELEVPAQSDAFKMQKKINRIYKDKVKDQLPTIFDELSKDGRTIRIPHLVIDIGVINPNLLEQEFVEKCLVAVRQELQKRVKAIDLSSDSKADHYQDKSDLSAFIYFLEHGTMPWYASYKNSIELEEKLWNGISVDQDRALIKKHLQKNDICITRLVQQFSGNFLDHLLEQLWQFSITDREMLITEIETIISSVPTTNFKRQLYHNIFSHLADMSNNDAFNFTNLRKRVMEDLEKGKLSITLAEDSNNEDVEKRVEHPEIKEVEDKYLEEIKDTSKQDYYIDNAGLVICAYYLKPFFDGLNLLNDDAFKNRDAQHRAIHLSQFLVIGDENPSEFQLVLNKVLCGMPINEPINRIVELTKTEHEEVDNLLQQIIKNWSVLGNSSIESLRNTFLNRKGKLSYDVNHSHWLLQVEQKGFDICVEKLPWTISVIKLPWMKESLLVDWV